MNSVVRVLPASGVYNYVMYPNGISMSLPADVQDKFLKTIPGLENVTMLRPGTCPFSLYLFYCDPTMQPCIVIHNCATGYAVEYDFVDPKQLKSTLETHLLKGNSSHGTLFNLK